MLRQRCCQDALPFIKHEEKRPVAAVVDLGKVHRSAGARAELVTLETCQWTARTVGEKIVGVEITVAQKLEYTAVQIVGSGFRDQRHDPAAAAPVLGGISVSL